MAARRGGDLPRRRRGKPHRAGRLRQVNDILEDRPHVEGGEQVTGVRLERRASDRLGLDGGSSAEARRLTAKIEPGSSFARSLRSRVTAPTGDYEAVVLMARRGRCDAPEAASTMLEAWTSLREPRSPLTSLQGDVGPRPDRLRGCRTRRHAREMLGGCRTRVSSATRRSMRSSVVLQEPARGHGSRSSAPPSVVRISSASARTTLSRTCTSRATTSLLGRVTWTSSPTPDRTFRGWWPRSVGCAGSLVVRRGRGPKLRHAVQFARGGGSAPWMLRVRNVDHQAGSKRNAAGLELRAGFLRMPMFVEPSLVTFNVVDGHARSAWR